MHSALQKIYEIVSKIPKGKVMTYGQIAILAECGPRFVGWAMHHNPDHNRIPCHRVVSAQGKLAQTYAFGGLDGQAKLLAKEGIYCHKGRVLKFEKYYQSD